jgi:SAM-dependent methyltransferase
VTTSTGISPSIEQPTYWWYRARSDLFAEIFTPWLPGEGRVLDVGSADGPSTAWAQGLAHRTSLDLDARRLQPGDVCASALALPFHDESFTAAFAFDVIEHCDPEATVVDELYRVLKPGGRLLVSVPAYSWAWSSFDVHQCHHRRYTRERLTRALERGSFRVERASYLFAGTFPAFVAERLRRKRRAVDDSEVLPAVPPAVERVLMGLCKIDRRVLRHGNLPFGSSVVAVATKRA